MNEAMCVAVCPEPHRIEVETRPVPPIDTDKILLKVSLCGICGSDLAVWSGLDRKYPYSPGHEFSGTVERMGANVKNLSAGQRVVVNPNLGCGGCAYCLRGMTNLCDHLKTRTIKSNGGFSNYVALDYRMVCPVPSSMSDETASFVEPLSCALHMVELARIGSTDTVAVFGGGILGMLVGVAIESQVSRERRAGRVLFVEPLPHRRRQLAGLFDAVCLDPRELPGSEWSNRIDVAIDCSGSLEAFSLAISALRKAGSLILGGLVPGAKEEVPLDLVTKKELSIKGSWLNPGTFEEALRLAKRRQSLLERLDTKTFPLSEVQQAFECAATKRFNKVFVRP